MKKGEIWWADLPNPWGRRLVLLLSRDEAYSVLRTALAAPLTTRIRRTPTHVVLTPDQDDVPETCAASLDNLQVVYQSVLQQYVTALSPQRMDDVERAIHAAFDLRY